MPATWTRLRLPRPEASRNIAYTVMVSAPSVPLLTKSRKASRKPTAASTSSPTRKGVTNVFKFRWLRGRPESRPYPGDSRLSEPHLEEVLQLGMGVAAQLPGRPLGHDLALEEKGHLVRHLEGRGDVVADDHLGHLELPLGREDHVVHVVGGDGVQTGGGLVVEDDLGVEHDRPGQAHPLAHA